MQLEDISSEATFIASTCLSEEWELTEKRIGMALKNWQAILSFITEEGSSSNIAKHYQEKLSYALQEISNAIKGKNAVLLSNTLIKLKH